jgi:hypothetical protein
VRARARHRAAGRTAAALQGEAPHSTASAIRSSSQPTLPSPTSAFSKIRAWMRAAAARFPVRISSSSGSRSSTGQADNVFGQWHGQVPGWGVSTAKPICSLKSNKVG